VSLYLKEDRLREVALVPVVCSSCHSAETLTGHDDALDYALVYGSYLSELREELRMWERGAQLFARFPESGHWLKVIRMRKERPFWPYFKDDAELENALLAEPDLYLFLRNQIAYLPGRMEFCKERIRKWEGELDFRLLKCTSCGKASLTLEPEFFESL
jgi:hypothetical protein